MVGKGAGGAEDILGENGKVPLVCSGPQGWTAAAGEDTGGGL